MGYRTYIAIADKEKIDALHDCQTEEEVVKVYQKYGWKISDYGEDGLFCPVYKIDIIDEHEFGKYYSNEELDSHSQPVYTSDELQEAYADYNFKFGGAQMLLDAIEDYRRMTEEYYTNLFNNTTGWAYKDAKMLSLSDEEKKENHYNMLLHAIKDKMEDWGENTRRFGLFPYNLEKDSKDIVSSWDREYAIFEFVRMYKSFDPDKHYCIYYGW